MYSLTRYNGLLLPRSRLAYCTLYYICAGNSEDGGGEREEEEETEKEEASHTMPGALKLAPWSGAYFVSLRFGTP